MSLQQRGETLKFNHASGKAIPQLLRGSRRLACPKFKQLGKPFVQTSVAVPHGVRPSAGKPVEVQHIRDGSYSLYSFTEEQPAIKNEPSSKNEPASKNEPFAWTKQWYPVAVLADMDTSRPHLVRMLGGKYVLWCDSKGEWHCQSDKCPHRLAPMSEGKIVGDTLQCSYHGWRFRGDGKCTFIPQATSKTHDAKAAHPKSCLKSFPLELRHGMIWVWPDESPDRFVVAAGTELAPEGPPEQGKDGLTWHTLLPWFVRVFPYSMETLFDNALDPSHVPWSHHGVIGNRDGVTPIELKVLEPVSPKGLKTEYFTLGGESTGNSYSTSKDEPVDPATLHVQFRAPHTLVYDTFRQDGTRAKLLAYALPTRPGECMVTAQTWDTRPSPLQKLPFSIPTWFYHKVFMAGGDGDTVLLKDQEMSISESPEGRRMFHTPTKADVGVQMWRQWTERFINGINSGPYQLASALEHESALLEKYHMPREKALDRYHHHVEKCPACLNAMEIFRKSTWVAGVAAAVFAQLSLLSALNLIGPAAAAASGAAVATSFALGPLTLPLHVIWAGVFAAASAVCVKLALVLHKNVRSYVFQDYVHAHI